MVMGVNHTIKSACLPDPLQSVAKHNGGRMAPPTVSR